MEPVEIVLGVLERRGVGDQSVISKEDLLACLIYGSRDFRLS